MKWFALLLAGALLWPCAGAERLRVIVETDAGGDPDDEQSLVRFLLYVTEWDIDYIIANRDQARVGENRNRERTGLGIVQQLIRAYGQCHTNLIQHDGRYPTAEFLLDRTIGNDRAVEAIIEAVDRPDPRPIWYMDWGTDAGATNNFQKAMDRVHAERSPAAYAKFKTKLRVIFHDRHLTNHTEMAPAWPIWVNTWEPPMDGKRWYHRYSALTARAGGFDLRKHVLENGPLGALYPTNTTHWQKEGDTPAFLYLVPTGMNDPNEPTWGSWAGRYGPHDRFRHRPYYWANQLDAWNGVPNRDNTLLRWAAHLQNDFRARMDWSTKPRLQANHPPKVRINGVDGISRTKCAVGDVLTLTPTVGDPDGNDVKLEWVYYREAGTYRGAVVMEGNKIRVPADAKGKTIHFVLMATDDGTPALTRYARGVLEVAEF